MKDFFKHLFASLLALVLFSGAIFLLFIGIAAAGGSKTSVPDKAVLIFDLSNNIPDSVRDGEPGEALRQALSGRENATPLYTLIKALDRAAADKRIAALYLTGNPESEGYGSGPAALKELKEAIQRFAASGKPVLAYNMGWGKKAYYLCAGTGKVIVNPFGEMEMTGLASEPMFFGGAFQKYGIEVQVTRVGKYKSAVEPFVLDKMSDANREQIAKLLGDIWGEWKTAVAKDRHKTAEDIQKISDEQGILLAMEAKAAGLVDQIAPEDEVLDQLKSLSGKTAKDKEFPQVSMDEYAGLPGEVQKGKNRIALVYAEGEIVDGDGDGGQVGGDKLARELRKLRLDKNVKAVVLRVNSPGGSASASELIQREVILTKKEKPVVISMGHLAASGGYWISTYGDHIFAEPNTITGSIGVFGLLPNVKKLANEHGITWDEVSTSKLANPMTLARPKSEFELARIQSVVDHIYDQFLSKVSESRRIAKADVNEIAQGRVWSGQEALKLKLVDEIGGLEDAIRFAAKKAKIENDYRVDGPGASKKPVEKLMEALAGEKQRKYAKGPAEQVMAEFQRQMKVFASLNDPQGVYARMPMELSIR
ncbi:MAG: signal peptide peptidase SppA [Holophagaceae bacterium]|nr:signal peptide peptidase SppA [Holophagaceae bacterium]